MTWVKTSSASGGTFAATASQTQVAGAAVAVGDLIKVVVSYGLLGGVPSSALIDDNGAGTNTFTRDLTVVDGTNLQNTECWTCVVTSAGTPTVRARFNPTPGTSVGQNCTLIVETFTGSDSASTTNGTPTGQLQVNPGNGTDAVTSGATTTSVNGCLIYGFTVETSLGTDPGSHGTGFTDGTASNPATTVAVRTEWLEQATAGARAATFTATSGTTNNFTTGVVATTPAAAPKVARPRPQGPGVSPTRRLQFQAKRAGLSAASQQTGALADSLTLSDSWSATGGSQPFGALRRQGPGVGPFSAYQFQARPVGFSLGSASLNALADSLTLSDSWTGTVVFSSALSDSLSLSDAWTGTAALVSSLSDSLSLSDSWAAVATFSSALADSLTLADVWAGGTAQVAALADSLTLADAFDATFIIPVQLADSLTLSDSWSAVFAAAGALSDTLTLSDSWGAIASMGADWADSLTLSDGFSAGAPPAVFVIDTHDGKRKRRDTGEQRAAEFKVSQQTRRQALVDAISTPVEQAEPKQVPPAPVSPAYLKPATLTTETRTFDLEAEDDTIIAAFLQMLRDEEEAFIMSLLRL